MEIEPEGKGETQFVYVQTSSVQPKHNPLSCLIYRDSSGGLARTGISESKEPREKNVDVKSVGS